MMYAARGTKCVKCGETIHHHIVPTGRRFPAGVEISDGFYYESLKGELCKDCDAKTPLKEKDPIMASAFEHMSKQIEKLTKRGDV